MQPPVSRCCGDPRVPLIVTSGVDLRLALRIRGMEYPAGASRDNGMFVADPACRYTALCYSPHPSL